MAYHICWLIALSKTASMHGVDRNITLKRKLTAKQEVSRHFLIFFPFNLTGKLFIPLTNRVRGPYLKLRTEFFPPRFMAQARTKIEGQKTRVHEVSKIFIISLVCVWGTQERFLFTRNGFKFLTHLESKTSQFVIVFKSLRRFLRKKSYRWIFFKLTLNVLYEVLFGKMQ